MFSQVLRRGVWLRQPLQVCKCVCVMQQTRGTKLFRRKYPVLPPSEAEDRPQRKYNEEQIEEQVLILDKNTDIEAGDMEVLLLRNAAGIGLKGQIATVKKSFARDFLLACGAAVYPSPENLEKYKKEISEYSEDIEQPLIARQTIRQLETMVLRVPMHPTNPWTLNKKHVRVAFRKMGVELKEDCITMPSEPITMPGEIELQLTMNNTETFPVKAVVYHHDKDAPTQAVEFPPVWTKSKKPLGAEI